MHQRWMYRKLRAWLVAVKIIPDRRHTKFKVHTEFQRQFGTHMCTRQCLLFGEDIFVSNKKWCYNKCVSDTTMLLESKVEGLCVAVIQTVHRKAACPLAASLPRRPLSDAAPRCHYHHNDYSTDWDKDLLFCGQELFFLILRNSDETKQHNSELLCIGIVSLLSAWGSVTISFSYLQKARVWGRLSISSWTTNKQLADMPVNFGNLLAIKVTPT